MKMPESLPENMVAPCGMNCFVCYARFPKKKEPCPGCRAQDADINRKSCQTCKIRQCANGRNLRFCAECEDFPCGTLKPLYKRYLSTHKIDLAQNGRDAARDMVAFLVEQRALFTCKHCGGVTDMHYNVCSECGLEISAEVGL